METNQIEALLVEHLSFWPRLTEEEKCRLVHESSFVHYKKGQHIYNGATDCLGVLILLEGELRVHILSPDGRDITLFRLFHNELCIFSASCLLQALSFDILLNAEQDSRALLVPAALIISLTEQNVYVENFSYQLTTERFSEAMWTLQQILFLSFDKRLAQFILNERERTGNDTISLTHELIAKYLGSAREVVTRMLRYFSDEKMVRLVRGGVIVLDADKLGALC